MDLLPRWPGPASIGPDLLRRYGEPHPEVALLGRP
jgi:hypothetical protein